MKKSIFLFFAAILCAMSVSAKVIYFKPNGNWAQANANFYAHVWGGSGATSPVKFTPVATDPTVYQAEIGTHNQVIFMRMDPSKTVTSSNMWNNPPLWNRMGNLSLPNDGKNCCTIKEGEWSVENGNTNGASSSVTWSTYTPPTVVVIPDRYITGTLAGGWNANDVKMTYDEVTETYSHTFTAVAANAEQKFKVTDGTWSKNWGGDAVSPAIDGITTDGDGNAVFTLSTAGDVTVTFKDSKIQVTTTGAFKVPVTYPYYILGTMNSWSVKEEYGLADEDEDGVYTREITLAAGEHFFKINIGKWDSQWGWSNVVGVYTEAKDAEDDNKIKITLASEKTFTVEFNKSKNQISFDGLTKIEDYYTVVGTEALFGTAWDCANADNNMEKLGDGSYKLVKENLTLAAITYEWKIAKNGDWWNDAATGVNPADNKNNNLVIATAGRYNVTFTLAADLKSATATTELLEAAVVIPDCFISGNATLTGGEGWQGNEFTMVYDEETETWAYTLAGLQPEKEYELKVVCGGTWYSFANLATPVPTGITEGNDHSIAFKMAAAGDVVVTYNVEAGITLSGNFAEPVTYDYYIAGTENLTGYNWKENGLGMIQDGELYKAIFSALPAGTFEFKITDGQWNTNEDKTHEWGYSNLGAAYEEVSEGTDGEGNPNGNIKFVTEEAKNITVIFDATAGKITFEGLTEIIPTYTVAGDSEAAFGTTWDPSNTANDMALEGGLYKWTKTNVALYANTKISFKVVKNHDWNKGQWPERDGENDNNWILQDGITADGLYTITITFKEDDKTINATATKTGDIVTKDFSNQPATLYFHPSFHWTSDAAQFAAYFYNNSPGADAEPTWANMTDSDGDGVYEVANAKQHEYVIICRMNPARTENNWDEDKTWNQIEHGITIPNTAGDLNTCLAFWTNCQGDVPTSECTWVAPTPLTDKNWDAFIAAYNGETINAVVERSFTSGQYHTLCLPFDIPTNWLGEGTKAYQLTSIVANESDKLSLNATLWNTIVAGQPYIIVPVKGSEYEHVIINGVTVKNASAGTNVASGDGYKATLKAVTATDGTTDGLNQYYVGANDGKLYNAQTDKLGLRAIIELTTTGGQSLPAKVRAYVAAEENEATGFENITAPEGQAMKVIENGQLIIIRGNEKFNAQGVRF